MSTIKRWFSKSLPVGVAVIVAGALISMGCSAVAKQKFDPGASGPQMIVEPAAISLGIAKLTSTPVAFRGKGFEAEDSVFINLLNVEKNGKTVNVPVAEAEVDANGNFTAKIGKLVKISELLRAKLGSNKKMETIIIITQPTIAPGTYTARAESMVSDRTAECKLVIKKPSIFDRIKDWIGGLLGKIEKK